MLRAGAALPADEPCPARADDLRPGRAAACDALFFLTTLALLGLLVTPAPAPRPLLSVRLPPPLLLRERSLLMICLLLEPAARPFGITGIAALSFNTCPALFPLLFATLKRAASAVSELPPLLTGPCGMLFERMSSAIRGFGGSRLEG